MKTGAPSKYRKEYCSAIIKHCANGASLTSFAADISVARSTIQEWVSVHPEFSVSVNIAKAKCAAWWEAQGRIVAVNGGGNATLCVFGMKNMAPDDWSDLVKTELSGEIKVARADELTDDQLAAIASIK
jgi:hypothetical protein